MSPNKEHSTVTMPPPDQPSKGNSEPAQHSLEPIKDSDGTGDDFEKMPLDAVMRRLECTPEGLTSAEAQIRLQKFGANKLEETKKNPVLEYLKFFWNPLSWCMEVAALIAIILVDYIDFILIIVLLIINATIGYYEESSADNAIAALTASLAPKAKALRDGKYETIDASELVPGDVILIRLGDVLPADVKILGDEHDEPMLIDQAALTGESLPVKRFVGQSAFSGSAVKQGERDCLVYATGANTFFGKAASLIDASDQTGHLQKVLTIIGATCIGTILVWVVIELAVQFGHYDHSCGMGAGNCPTLENMLVILVGGIPIAMPTVLSVTLALGAFKLAQKGAIVSRLTAIEEVAGMDMLCSDKTGTLTLNQLSVDRPNLSPQEPRFTPEDITLYGALGARIENEEPIDMCVHNAYENKDTLWDEWELLKYTPFNPVDKRTVALVKHKETGRVLRAAKGAPQVILKMARNYTEIKDQFEGKILEYAGRGYRALGVGISEGESNDSWDFVGLIPIFDPPRHDTKSTIERCIEMGIGVKMITGDQLPIGIETARQLGMGTNMHTTDVFKQAEGANGLVMGTVPLDELVEQADGFAEVFPEHKYDIVARLQRRGHMTGMTGDGVNDAPALKKADIGIAVAGATDAARAAADIVLTEPGLGVIIDAVIGARKIFQRMKSYAKYTIAMTFRICFTCGLLTVIYNWYFPTILIVLLAIFNDGAMISLSKDRVQASPSPDAWFLTHIFIAGLVYGLYLTLSSWVLFYLASQTDFFSGGSALDLVSLQYGNAYDNCQTDFGLAVTDPNFNQCVAELQWSRQSMLRALMYAHISISGMALIFVTRTHKFSWADRPGNLLVVAFLASQLIASIIAGFGLGGYEEPSDYVDPAQWAVQYDGAFTGKAPVAGSESFYTPSVIGCGTWVLVAWVWAIIWYIPLDFIKFFMQWVLEGENPFAWWPLPRFMNKTLVPGSRATVAGSTLGASRATIASSGRPRQSRVVRGSVF